MCVCVCVCVCAHGKSLYLCISPASRPRGKDCGKQTGSDVTGLPRSVAVPIPLRNPAQFTVCLSHSLTLTHTHTQSLSSIKVPLHDLLTPSAEVSEHSSCCSPSINLYRFTSRTHTQTHTDPVANTHALLLYTLGHRWSKVYCTHTHTHTYTHTHSEQLSTSRRNTSAVTHPAIQSFKIKVSKDRE